MSNFSRSTSSEVQNLIGRHIGDLGDGYVTQDGIEWDQLWPVVDRDTLEVIGVSDGSRVETASGVWDIEDDEGAYISSRGNIYDLANIIVDGARARLVDVGSAHACDVLVLR